LLLTATATITAGRFFCCAPFLLSPSLSGEQPTATSTTSRLSSRRAAPWGRGADRGGRGEKGGHAKNVMKLSLRTETVSEWRWEATARPANRRPGLCRGRWWREPGVDRFAPACPDFDREAFSPWRTLRKVVMPALYWPRAMSTALWLASTASASAVRVARSRSRATMASSASPRAVNTVFS